MRIQNMKMEQEMKEILVGLCEMNKITKYGWIFMDWLTPMILDISANTVSGTPKRIKSNFQSFAFFQKKKEWPKTRRVNQLSG